MPPLARNHTAAAPKTRPTRTPDHPAARNAVRRFFVRPHTAASSIRPPSRGNPGNAFSTAKISDSQARYPTMSETTPAVARWATQNTPESTSVVAGPTEATRNSPSGPRMSARVSVAPPQKTSVTPRTGRSSVRAMTACAASCARMLAKKSAAASTARKIASPEPAARPRLTVR